MFLVNDLSNSIMSLNTNTRINHSQSLDYHTVHASSDIIAIVPTDTSMRPDASNSVFDNVHDKKMSESLCDSTFSKEISSKQVTEWDTQFLNATSDSTTTSIMQSSPQVIEFSNATSDSNRSSIMQGSQQVSLSQVNEQDQTVPNSALNLGFRDKGFRIGHLNIQGISNKIEQLRLLLRSIFRE